MVNSVTIFNNELEYKLTLRNSISTVFQLIRYEVFSVIDFIGHSKNDYVLNPYPLTISRVDGKPVSNMLLGCIRAKLGGRELVS
jgi:hypothetical protein